MSDATLLIVLLISFATALFAISVAAVALQMILTLRAWAKVPTVLQRTLKRASTTLEDFSESTRVFREHREELGLVISSLSKIGTSVDRVHQAFEQGAWIGPLVALVVDEWKKIRSHHSS
jgi:hypothetical protein